MFHELFRAIPPDRRLRPRSLVNHQQSPNKIYLTLSYAIQDKITTRTCTINEIDEKTTKKDKTTQVDHASHNNRELLLLLNFSPTSGQSQGSFEASYTMDKTMHRGLLCLNYQLSFEFYYSCQLKLLSGCQQREGPPRRQVLASSITRQKPGAQTRARTGTAA